jgi:hypothetical protein
MKNKRKRARPTKATHGLLKAVLADIARGLNRADACRVNGVSISTWKELEKRSEFPQLRAKATANRILFLIEQVEKSDHKSFKEWSWLLERTFPDQFGKGRLSGSSGA